MDKRITLDLVGWLAFCLSLLHQQIDVVSVLLNNHLVQARDYSVAKLVGTKGDAELVSCNLETTLQMRQDLVVHLVHAQVQVLELRVLDSHPNLDSLSLRVFGRNLLDVVQHGYWLFGLLASFEFFVLFDDCVSVLEGLQLILDLVLREGELAEHFENGDHVLVLKVKLGEAEVFKGAVGIEHIVKLSDSLSGELLVGTNIDDFDCGVMLEAVGDAPQVCVSQGI